MVKQYCSKCMRWTDHTTSATSDKSKCRVCGNITGTGILSKLKRAGYWLGQDTSARPSESKWGDSKCDTMSKGYKETPKGILGDMLAQDDIALEQFGKHIGECTRKEKSIVNKEFKKRRWEIEGW